MAIFCDARFISKIVLFQIRGGGGCKKKKQ